MSIHKNIYWREDIKADREGEMFANVHLLVGYNQGSLADFKKMADMLRETFPQATDEQICGGTVSKSTYVKGFTIITWNASIEKKEYSGWFEHDHGQMEYYW